MEDPVIKRHFNYLYNQLLEDNLKKILEPYSEVQIDYIAECIGLPMDRILQKLSEMILDEVINGTLDQGRNCMIIYEEAQSNEVFEHAIDTFKNLDGVVDSLYEKTQNYKKTYLSWKVCQILFQKRIHFLINYHQIITKYKLNLINSYLQIFLD